MDNKITALRNKSVALGKLLAHFIDFVSQSRYSVVYPQSFSQEYAFLGCHYFAGLV